MLKKPNNNQPNQPPNKQPNTTTEKKKEKKVSDKECVLTTHFMVLHFSILSEMTDFLIALLICS